MKKNKTTKYLKIAEMLKQRIKRGDYAFRKLPSESDLAEEAGVSRMTARKALLRLIDTGVLSRRRFGRLEIVVASSGRKKVSQFAFLMPPVGSRDVQVWYWAAEKAVMRVNGILRPIVYSDWNDVLIPAVLRGFDGVFLMQAGDEMPQSAVNVLTKADARVVSLDLDLCSSGIPSVWLFPPACVHVLLDHLKDFGHKRIGCLNTNPLNPVIKGRMTDCQNWCQKNKIQWKLINIPSQTNILDGPATLAQEEVNRMLKSKSLNVTALVCTTVWSALGAMQAVQKNGLKVGDDISICAVNDERLAFWTSPSLTSLRMSDPEEMLSKCIKWMTGARKKWGGPKLLTPAEVPLFIGYSTGAPPKKGK